jgi:hypothetical protein
MLKVLTWKELRELAPLILLAALAQIHFLSLAMGVSLVPLLPMFFALSPQHPIPFVSDLTCTWMLIVAGLLACGIGLWQTMREGSAGTYLFLLHRPRRREVIFAAKLTIGVTVCLVASALPVLIYALWAAVPGHHASPFEWSMTRTVWGVVPKMPLVYLGAFLSGVRPGRLFGSRFLPLAAGATAIVMLHVLSLISGLPGLTLMLCLLLEACFVHVILDVAATRDF